MDERLSYTRNTRKGEQLRCWGWDRWKGERKPEDREKTKKPDLPARGICG